MAVSPAPGGETDGCGCRVKSCCGCWDLHLSVPTQLACRTAQPSLGNFSAPTVIVAHSGCSFVFALGRCKKRRPKPFPSLPGAQQPGPHPGGCRVVEGHMGTALKGHRRIRAVPDVRASAQHGGAMVCDGAGAHNRMRRERRGRKGHPPPDRQSGSSAQLSRRRHIHRTYAGGHRQAQTPAGARGDVTYVPQFGPRAAPLPAPRMHARTCTCTRMHTYVYTHRGQRSLCLCTMG